TTMTSCGRCDGSMCLGDVDRPGAVFLVPGASKLASANARRISDGHIAALADAPRAARKLLRFMDFSFTDLIRIQRTPPAHGLPRLDVRPRRRPRGATFRVDSTTVCTRKAARVGYSPVAHVLASSCVIRARERFRSQLFRGDLVA